MNKRHAQRLLGGLPVEEFLSDFWHRKPLFVKHALDPARLSIAPDELLSLAAREDVESRVVSQARGQWSLKHGPIDTWPRARRDWTLLVQGVDLHDTRAEHVLDDFRWLPAARLDDIMISHAVDGGGVGPHFDSYDVFLLQASGTRRWRISMQRDLSLVEGVPLKILANFKPTHEFVCEPGDLLYLPPHCAHEGVAIGPCTTWSVGFRAPSHDELLRNFYDFAADTLEISGRYADAGLKWSANPARIPEKLLSELDQLIDMHTPNRAMRECFLGEYLSAPKASVIFTPPVRALAIERWLKKAEHDGIRLDARTRMLHDRRHVFINGDSLIATSVEGRVLRKLADARRLSALDVTQAPSNVRELLHCWYTDGWLHTDHPTRSYST
ncbi:MAG TPA: cupin domain-containing protein [Burkholderiaceae bacterium]|nr:cupin domain-containing protein [Burkholderiaceae bacterium]